MARLPKDLFSKFQEYLGNEQELREVSVDSILLQINFQIQYKMIEVICIMLIFGELYFNFYGNLQEIRTIMKEIDVSVRDATLALQIVHTSLSEGN